jgi:hypothetical protein
MPKYIIIVIIIIVYYIKWKNYVPAANVLQTQCHISFICYFGCFLSLESTYFPYISPVSAIVKHNSELYKETGKCILKIGTQC